MHNCIILFHVLGGVEKEVGKSIGCKLECVLDMNPGVRSHNLCLPKKQREMCGEITSAETLCIESLLGVTEVVH